MRPRARRDSSGPPALRQLVLAAVMAVGLVACGGAQVAAPTAADPSPDLAPAVDLRPTIGRTLDPPVTPVVPAITTQVPPSSTAARTMETMTAAEPVRLTVPAIGVDSELLDLSLADDGTLEVPPSGFPAGWFTGAPTPGELGPAIITGHVDWDGQPGVFSDLGDLVQGDAIEVGRGDGSTARFQVTEVQPFAKNEFPTEMVYGDLDHAGLRLITCDGRFDGEVGSYADNLVVFAEFVGSETAG